MNQHTWRQSLTAGESYVLSPSGIFLVVEVLRTGLVVRSSEGQTSSVLFGEISSAADEKHALSAPSLGLNPGWSALSHRSRVQALDRLAVVLETVTGYRFGHPELARPSEPAPSFDPTIALSVRARSMARQITLANGQDRHMQDRVEKGELKGVGVSASTVMRWIRCWSKDGLWGLVDERAAASIKAFDRIDARYKRAAQREVRQFTGAISSVSLKETTRRIHSALVASGDADAIPSPALQSSFVGALRQAIGKTTRSHRTRFLSQASGTTHAGIVRPGQMIAIDATRSDVMVYDPVKQAAISVEIISAMDVYTRLIVATRVVPKSADGLDAGLLLFDVMRGFAHLGQDEDSLWVPLGVPGAIQLDEAAAIIPGLAPTAIRADHGSIFVSDYFREILRKFGIDLWLSRGKKPTDNAFIERWHETLQDFMQRQPSYKGRNPSERGSRVGKPGTVVDLTARQLEAKLRSWVALEYNQRPHTGIPQGKEHGANLSPIQLYDASVAFTGRLDIPSHPDLVYQFLPVEWRTIRSDGVEIKNMVYDAPCLNAYRHSLKGSFRAEDAKAPFYRYPHDSSRIFFPRPDSDGGGVHEVPWRGAALLRAPMSEAISTEALKRLGDKLPGRRHYTEDAIADAINSWFEARPGDFSAAAMRVDGSHRDFGAGNTPPVARRKTAPTEQQTAKHHRGRASDNRSPDSFPPSPKAPAGIDWLGTNVPELDDEGNPI